MGSLRDREVACSASDRQGSNFESCVWRTVSSQSSHHPQEVLLAQFSLYVHKGGLKPDSCYLDQLHAPPVRTSVGTRAFPVAAPRFWYELPLEIRSAKTQISFRKKLKTYILVRLYRLRSLVVWLAQTTNANGFENMSRITLVLVVGAIEVYIVRTSARVSSCNPVSEYYT